MWEGKLRPDGGSALLASQRRPDNIGGLLCILLWAASNLMPMSLGFPFCVMEIKCPCFRELAESKGTAAGRLGGSVG